MDGVRSTIADESGVSMVELLLAIMILGISVTAILAMIGTAINVSGVHRDLAEGEAVTRSVSEQIKQVAHFTAVPADQRHPCPPLESLAPTSLAGDWQYEETPEVRYWLPLLDRWGTFDECEAEYETICSAESVALADCVAARSFGGLQEVFVKLIGLGEEGDVTTSRHEVRVYTRRVDAEIS